MAQTKTIFSREFLRDLPNQEKKRQRKEYLHNSLECHGHYITDAATMGLTSCLISNDDFEKPLEKPSIHPWMDPPTKEEFQGLFKEVIQEKFPGCKLTYEESWTTRAKGNRVLNYGIRVDWS